MPTNDKKPVKPSTPDQATAATDAQSTAQSAKAAGATPVTDPASKSIGPMVAAYTMGRLVVFVVIAVIFYLVGFRGLPGMLGAAILSIPVSYFLLAKTRVELANRIAARKESELNRKDAFRTAGK